jgi:hypothetical protein
MSLDLPYASVCIARPSRALHAICALTATRQLNTSSRKKQSAVLSSCPQGPGVLGINDVRLEAKPMSCR